MRPTDAHAMAMWENSNSRVSGMHPTEGEGCLEQSFPSKECFPLRLEVSPLRSPSLIGTVTRRSLFSTMCVKDPCVPWSTNGDEAEGVRSTVPLSQDTWSHSREVHLRNGHGGSEQCWTVGTDVPPNLRDGIHAATEVNTSTTAPRFPTPGSRLMSEKHLCRRWS
jgi:hypothetical protein